MKIKPPLHVVWSTDEIDLSDPFQRTWYIRQVLLQGWAEDVKTLDVGEIAGLLEDLEVPPHPEPLARLPERKEECSRVRAF